MSINYMHMIEQTDEEKLKMYMKSTKLKLAEMLLESNRYKRPMEYTYTNHQPSCACDKCGGYRSFWVGS